MATRTMVCRESFWTNVDGTSQLFTEGKSFVSEDSDIYQRFPQNFRPAEDVYRSESEQATSAPGEKRAVKL